MTKTKPEKTIDLTALLWSREAVLRSTTMSSATLDRLINAGRFPAPVRLGTPLGGSSRVAWLRTEVEEWVRQLAAQPRAMRSRSAELAAMPSA